MVAILDAPSWVSGFTKLQESVEIERKVVKANKGTLIEVKSIRVTVRKKKIFSSF